MNKFQFTKLHARLLLLAAAPVVGILIYRSLTPSQKKRLKKSFNSGSAALATAFINRLAENYRAGSTNQPLSRSDMVKIPHSGYTA